MGGVITSMAMPIMHWHVISVFLVLPGRGGGVEGNDVHDSWRREVGFTFF